MICDKIRIYIYHWNDYDNESEEWTSRFVGQVMEKVMISWMVLHHGMGTLITVRTHPLIAFQSQSDWTVIRMRWECNWTMRLDCNQHSHPVFMLTGGSQSGRTQVMEIIKILAYFCRFFPCHLSNQWVVDCSRIMRELSVLWWYIKLLLFGISFLWESHSRQHRKTDKQYNYETGNMVPYWRNLSKQIIKINAGRNMAPI